MQRPKICVSLPASEKTPERIPTLTGEPELIEVRLDYPQGINLKAVRKATSLTLIATARIKEQGGLWMGRESERLRILLSALDAGFDYIDIEASTSSLTGLVEDVHSRGARLIASAHNLRDTQSSVEMRRVLKSSKKKGVDICKVIGTANYQGDNITYLDFLKDNPGNVSFGMGKLGVPSRVISPLIGGAWTYASPTEGEEVAPGQLTAIQLRNIYQLMGVDE